LFPSPKIAPEEFPVPDVDIEAMMVVSGHDDVVLEEDDGIYEKGDKFKSFHRQTSQSMSRHAC